MLLAWVGSKKKGRLKKVCVFSKGEEVAAWVKKVKKLKCFQGRQQEMEWPKVDTKLKIMSALFRIS